MSFAKLKQEVKKLGGKITGGLVGRYYSYHLEAPDGHVWGATGDTTQLALEWKAGDKKWKEDAIADALDRVSYGVAVSDETDD